MTKKAIVYARVSTDDQAEHGFSLEAQIEAGRDYATAHGFDVTLEAIDGGVSGALAFKERPRGALAWAALRGGKANALIVQNVDRLSRDVVDLLVVVRELLRAGVEVHCIDLGRVESEYDIMLVIRGWQGSDERAKIRERSIRGIRKKLSQGMVTAGRAAYGYEFLRDDKGRLINFEIVEDQAAVVRLIFQLYTEGDGDSGPLSINAIAKRLSEAGIPTPRKRKYSGWEPSSVSRMLKNPTYKGQWEYKAKAIDGRPAKTFTIEIPAIVAAATWEAAQTQRERNRRKSKRNAKREYLLRGLIKCVCGRIWVGRSRVADGKRYASYQCGAAMRHGKEVCGERAINAKKIEKAVWEAVLTVINDAPTLETDLREAQRREFENREPQREELATVLALIADAESEAEKLATALTKATGIVAKTLEDKMVALDERYNLLIARRDDLEELLATLHLTDETIAGTVEFAQSLQTGIENADNDTKRQLIDVLGARITVVNGQATLHLDIANNTPIDLQSLRITQLNTTIKLKYRLDLLSNSPQ